MQITRDIRPDRVVLLGDMIDFPEFASKKFSRPPTLARGTNATIYETSKMLAVLRSVVGADVPIEYLEGNHEMRLPKTLADSSIGAFGVSRPGESWPVLSVPNLCLFDRYDITWHPGFPAAQVFIREETPGGAAIVAEHGRTVQLKKRLDDAYFNVIMGHVHHQEQRTKTIQTGRGTSRRIKVVSPGCLCRVDGFVPSRMSGIDDRGLPIGGVADDWQQGMMVVTHEAEGLPNFEHIEFEDGVCRFRGKRYTSGEFWSDSDMDGVDPERYSA